jgi:hypothetical protein
MELAMTKGLLGTTAAMMILTGSLIPISADTASAATRANSATVGVHHKSAHRHLVRYFDSGDITSFSSSSTSSRSPVGTNHHFR